MTAEGGETMETMAPFVKGGGGCGKGIIGGKDGIGTPEEGRGVAGMVGGGKGGWRAGGAGRRMERGCGREGIAMEAHVILIVVIVIVVEIILGGRRDAMAVRRGRVVFRVSIVIFLFFLFFVSMEMLIVVGRISF